MEVDRRLGHPAHRSQRVRHVTRRHARVIGDRIGW
jgi:hypothetical protein